MATVTRIAIVSLLILAIIGLNSAEAIKGGLGPIKRLLQCQDGCLEKFAIREALCQQRPECSTSGFPPYNYNSLPDALHLLCWDECAKPPPPKINKSILETWALRTVSMLQQDSLVLVDVAWAPLNTPNQCLVTWEVSGGGLMGNLLTESSNVQLSLWPETKYRVQVTCKNKINGSMSRSLPLAIDTSEAVPATVSNNKSQQQTSSPTATPSIVPTTPITTTTTTTTTTSKMKPSRASKPRLFPDANLFEPLTVNDQNTILRFRTVDPDPDTEIEKDPREGDVTVDKMHDLNMIAIKSLSDLHKPLLLGVVAATLLLALVLCLYICTVRNQRIPSDKQALIDDDGNAIATAIAVAAAAGITNHFGSGPNIDGGISTKTTNTDPSLYSRTVHVLTV